jgi:uncharacterized protein
MTPSCKDNCATPGRSGKNNEKASGNELQAFQAIAGIGYNDRDRKERTMNRDEVLQKLQAERGQLREQFGVESLALFGSLARDEACPGSDVDLLVEFASPITLFDLVALQQHLERCLGVPRVDLVPRDSIYPAFRKTILEGAVDVS